MGSAVLYTSDAYNVLQTENILDLAGTTIMSFRFLWPYQAQNEDYANQWFSYRYDVRGSVTNITNPQGEQVKGYKYNEFGQTKEAGQESFQNELTFTGSVKDTSTGLQYMNARFYEPQTGRFLSQDTYSGNAYDPWTQHLYAYCANNPVNFIDPTGHSYGREIGTTGIYVSDAEYTTIQRQANQLGVSTYEAYKVWHSIGGAGSGVSEKTTGALKKANDGKIMKELGITNQDIELFQKNVANAKPLERGSTDPTVINETNCLGSPLGIKKIMRPAGYEFGWDTWKVYNSLRLTLGENNIRRLVSVNSSVAPGEIMVAIRCAKDDYHFIVNEDGTRWDKPGRTPFIETDDDYITKAGGWDSRELIDGEVVTYSENVYSDKYGPIIYTAIKKELIF